MKTIFLAYLLFITGFSVQAQTYKPVTSKNKTYLASVKGLSYSYKNGIVMLKNNGSHDMGTVSIIASSTLDTTLFGIALFEDGLSKGQTASTEVYFTTGHGKDTHELLLSSIDQRYLVFSFDKAVRAMP